MNNILKLASSHQPKKRGCRTCLHYQPAVSWLWHKTKVTWNWRFHFRHVEWLPDASSHEFARCSFFNGSYASIMRRYDCENGEGWEPRENGGAQ